MKKGVMFLIFAMILTMIVPAFALELPQEKLTETLSYDDVNGKYVVSVKSGDEWNEIGSMEFGKNQSKQTMDLGNYLSDNTIIRLSQDSGGSAYLDSVLLSGQPALKANENDEKVLDKLSKEDLDITPVGEEGVVLEFGKSGSGVLTVIGRIEPVIIGKEPLQFPEVNTFKPKEYIRNFYNYKLNSNSGFINVDGSIDEVSDKAPFIKEYRNTTSGHPSGDTYIWVTNDKENLYVTMDVTPDNTFDGDKDYAKVYVNTDKGIKEFKVSVPETTWGNTGFTYTNKVVYEHKVYEFSIPLNEIISSNQEDLELAFVIYGTVSFELELGYHKPSVAYDPKNNVYLCVFEHVREIQGNYGYFKVSEIYADVIKSDGTIIVNDYPLIEYDNKLFYTQYQFTPSIEYNSTNGSFLVTWNQSDYFIYAVPVKINKDYSISSGNAFLVSDYNDYYHKKTPQLAYDNLNDRFLVIWSQTSNNSGFDILGRIVSDENIISDNKIGICLDANDQENPQISYSYGHEKFLVTWLGWHDYFGTYVDAQVVGDGGEIKESDKIRISEDGSSPNVSINDLNDLFLVTWEENSKILGNYISLSISGTSLGDNIKITPNDNYFGCYPSSYYDGDNSMLCVWSSAPGDGDYFARLNYVDNLGNPGTPFFDPSDMQDRLYSYESPISITGNYNGQFIIAYAVKERNDIGYRLIGETIEFEPYIKFEPSSYTVQEGGTEDVLLMFYYDKDMEPVDVTNNVIYEYDSTYVNVNNTGKIAGIKPIDSTTIKAYYMPFVEASFSEEDSNFSNYPLFAEATVTVTPKPGKPNLSFSKETYTVEIGGSPYQTTVNYFDGLVNHPNITENVEQFSVDDNSIATITSGGAITALAVGRTTISAIYLDCIATANLEVKEKDKPTPPPSGGGGGGPIKTPIGQITVDNKVIKDIYEEDIKAINNSYTFTADKTGNSTKLWLDGKFYKSLAENYPNRIIKFNWENGSYTLPLSSDEVSDEIDSSAKKLNIQIKKVNDKNIVKAANKSAENIGADIISDLIDFSIIVEKNKQNIEIESLDFYAERTINNLDNISEEISTAMKFVEDKEYLTFAPSVFDDDYATIKYRGNGIFTLIENPQTFDDIANHWARLNVEKLATRNIAFGRENNNFAPDDFITRAEFAVMITRALGITEEEGSNDFKDVANEWFAEDIGTAFKAGLISGRNDGKFYPNEKIKRQDMAVMIQNALKLVELKNMDISNAESVLSMFKDKNTISDYARESIAICADAGIIMGRDTKNFDPNDNATRSEASAIIERMLRYLDFMN